MSERALPSTGGRRWATSAVIAVSVHACVVAACFVRFWNPAPDATLLTAIAIDVAPLPSAPPVPEHDIPTPKQIEAPMQRPQKKPAAKPLPFTPPRALAMSDVKPEVVLPTRPERSPETKNGTEPKSDQTTREAAPDLPPDKKVAAPNDGGYNPGDASPEMLWYSQVMAKVQKLKRYPMLARVRNQQDDVALAIAIDRAGKLLSVEITRSGGFELLDKESLEVVRRAAPFPEPPVEVAGEMIKLSLIVQFAIGGNPTVIGVNH